MAHMPALPCPTQRKAEIAQGAGNLSRHDENNFQAGQQGGESEGKSAHLAGKLRLGTPMHLTGRVDHSDGAIAGGRQPNRAKGKQAEKRRARRKACDLCPREKSREDKQRQRAVENQQVKRIGGAEAGIVADLPRDERAHAESHHHSKDHGERKGEGIIADRLLREPPHDRDLEQQLQRVGWQPCRLRKWPSA